jgi:hypothetical protein
VSRLPCPALANPHLQAQAEPIWIQLEICRPEQAPGMVCAKQLLKVRYPEFLQTTFKHTFGLHARSMVQT